MWGKIIIPMYRLWLCSLYGLYGLWRPLSPKMLLNLITHTLIHLYPPWYTGIIVGMGLANDRQHYNVMLSLISWAHTQKDPWYVAHKRDMCPDAADIYYIPDMARDGGCLRKCKDQDMYLVPQTYIAMFIPVDNIRMFISHLCYFRAELILIKVKRSYSCNDKDHLYQDPLSV